MPQRGLPSLARRVLFRLERAEEGESNPHLRDDYRIAWITLLNAARGYSRPHISAWYTVLGLHPDKVWPAMVERRKALLGQRYSSFYGEGVLARKPARSVRTVTFPSRADRAA